MEGITLNPLEWLLSNDGAEIMTFNSVDEAKGFSQRKRIPGRGHGVSSICRGVDVTWLDY